MIKKLLIYTITFSSSIIHSKTFHHVKLPKHTQNTENTKNDKIFKSAIEDLNKNIPDYDPLEYDPLIIYKNLVYLPAKADPSKILTEEELENYENLEMSHGDYFGDDPVTEDMPLNLIDKQSSLNRYRKNNPNSMKLDIRMEKAGSIEKFEEESDFGLENSSGDKIDSEEGSGRLPDWQKFNEDNIDDEDYDVWSDDYNSENRIAVTLKPDENQSLETEARIEDYSDEYYLDPNEAESEFSVPILTTTRSYKFSMPLRKGVKSQISLCESAGKDANFELKQKELDLKIRNIGVEHSRVKIDGLTVTKPELSFQNQSCMTSIGIIVKEEVEVTQQILKDIGCAFAELFFESYDDKIIASEQPKPSYQPETVDRTTGKLTITLKEECRHLQQPDKDETVKNDNTHDSSHHKKYDPAKNVKSYSATDEFYRKIAMTGLKIYKTRLSFYDHSPQGTKNVVIDGNDDTIKHETEETKKVQSSNSPRVISANVGSSSTSWTLNSSILWTVSVCLFFNLI